MRVAILALGPSLVERPSADWENWGLAWAPDAPRYDLLFEPHVRKVWGHKSSYVTRLRDMDVPIMMTRTYPDISMGVPYPLETVCEDLNLKRGRLKDYFGSSIAYMVALAIQRGALEIGMWGADCRDNDDAYAHQRPNVEFLLGIAHARGIKITISEGSALLTLPFPERYGLA